MGWALLKPWNLAFVAAVVVLSGPLTVAAICTSLLSATLLGLLAGAILLHAAFTSICRVILWPLVSSPPASAAKASTSSRGSSHTRGLSSETPVPRQPSPLLVIQGSSRSRTSRGSSLSQRVTLPVPSTGSSPGSTTTSSSSTSSSASPSFNSGFPFNGDENGSTPGTGLAGSGGHGHRHGVFGLGAGQGPTGEGGSSATRGGRHSLVPPVGGPPDGNGVGTGGFYEDDDDELDGYYYYLDEIEHGGSGGWPSDFAPQLTLSSRVFHHGNDMNPMMRLFQQQHQQYSYNHPQRSQLLTMLRSGGGQAMPVASNSSRRRASIGGVPSLLRAGGAGAGFGGSNTPTAAYAASRSGSSTPWKRTRQTSEFGL